MLLDDLLYLLDKALNSKDAIPCYMLCIHTLMEWNTEENTR